MEIARGALRSRLRFIVDCCTTLALGGCGGGSSSTPSSSSVSSSSSGGSSPPTYTKKAIAGIFAYPSGVAVDTNGDVFVSGAINDVVKEIPFSGGSYGTAITLASGFKHPYGIAVDAKGDVFVADYGNRQ